MNRPHTQQQGDVNHWVMSNSPSFYLLQTSTETKGIISHCYQMLLTHHLKAHPTKAPSLWEKYIGPLTGDQWEEVLQSITTCSLNVMQKVSQLYIVLQVHYTPLRLHKMGRRPDPLCGRCGRRQGGPKLHRYWSTVLGTLNRVFQMTVPRTQSIVS